MTRYCGEILEVIRPTDVVHAAIRPGSPAVAKHAREHPSSAAESGFPVRLPRLVLGKHRFRYIRLFRPGLLACLREGETVCIYTYRHLLLERVMIGVRSGDGPSWMLDFGPMLAGVCTYASIGALLSGMLWLLAGTALGMTFGHDGIVIGAALGLLCGVGLSWLTALRLVQTWREMRHG